jgi:hypothetical protein
MAFVTTPEVCFAESETGAAHKKRRDRNEHCDH